MSYWPVKFSFHTISYFKYNHRLPNKHHCRAFLTVTLLDDTDHMTMTVTYLDVLLWPVAQDLIDVTLVLNRDEQPPGTDDRR